MIAKIKVFVCRRGEMGSFQSLDYLVLAVLAEFLSFFRGKNTSNLAKHKKLHTIFSKKGHITKFLLQFMFESIL